VADRRTAAEAAALASMRRPMRIHSRATNGRTAPTRQGKVLRPDREYHSRAGLRATGHKRGRDFREPQKIALPQVRGSSGKCRFKHRKHRAGRSRQTKSGAEANQNRSTTQYGHVNRSVQVLHPDLVSSGNSIPGRRFHLQKRSISRKEIPAWVSKLMTAERTSEISFIIFQFPSVFFTISASIFNFLFVRISASIPWPAFRISIGIDPPEETWRAPAGVDDNTWHKGRPALAIAIGVDPPKEARQTARRWRWIRRIKDDTARRTTRGPVSVCRGR
jgi:hypothetical protein